LDEPYRTVVELLGWARTRILRQQQAFIKRVEANGKAALGQ